MAPPAPFGMAPPLPHDQTNVSGSTFAVELRAPPGVAFELSLPELAPKDTLVAACVGFCVVRVVPAVYVVYVHSSAHGLAGGQAVPIYGPSTVAIEPDSPAQRWGGLALGIGGSIAGAVGLHLLDPKFGGLWCRAGAGPTDHDCVSDHSKETRAFGGVLALASLVAVPVGWVMFGSSFKPSVNVTGEYSPRRTTPWVAIAPAPGMDRAGVALLGTF